MRPPPALPASVPARICNSFERWSATRARTSRWSSSNAADAPFASCSSSAAGASPMRDATSSAVPLDTVRVGIVSVSDRASSGTYEDKGIPALREWLTRAVLNPIEWQARLIPDDEATISATLRELVDELAQGRADGRLVIGDEARLPLDRVQHSPRQPLAQGR